MRTTGEILGVYAVHAFFILSGFLVTESAFRTPGAGRFLWKRALRIVPAFVVSTLAVALLVCPFFADRGGVAFVFPRDTVSHVLRTIFLVDKGLYFESAPFFQVAQDQWIPRFANGSIWTIRLEVFCYVLVAVLSSAGLLRRGTGWIVLAAGVVGNEFAPRL